MLKVGTAGVLFVLDIIILHIQALPYCWSILLIVLTVRIMKAPYLLQCELELFTHTTRSFYMTEFWLIELLVLDHIVLTDIIIMEVDIITVVARVVTMTPSEIKVPRQAVMWWMSC